MPYGRVRAPTAPCCRYRADLHGSAQWPAGAGDRPCRPMGVMSHEYTACDDEDCPRFTCRVYKEGYADGYGDGHGAGYAAGRADGYAEGHADGYADGSAGAA